MNEIHLGVQIRTLRKSADPVSSWKYGDVR